MRICFSAIGSGIANNGGSKTVLSCANVLSDLGHEVFVASTVWNFDWFKVKAKRINKLPKDVDAIIATAVSTVEPLVKFNTRAKKRWYLRGWETWGNPEEKMVNGVKSIKCITNSEWLSEKVRSISGRKSPIIYPGIDDYFYKEERDRDDIVTIGGLYNSKKLKRFGLWKGIVAEVFSKRKIRVILFGDEPKPKLPFDFQYCRKPKPDQHRRLYNNCDIWFFTSSNEGLHIPPMEAGKCGCALVGVDIGGVRDYAINNETALLGHPGECLKNIFQLVDNCNFRERLSDNLLELINSKIGNRQDNMRKLVEVLR